MPKKIDGPIANSPCSSCIFLMNCRKSVLAGNEMFCELESPMYPQFVDLYGESWPGATYWDIDFWLRFNNVPVINAKTLPFLRQKNLEAEYATV